MSENLEKFINEVSQEIAELPDRNSPDDWPEAMLVTHDELKEIITGVHETFPLFTHAMPKSEEWQTIDTAPEGAKGVTWLYLAWGDDEDKHTGEGMRIGDKYYAAGTFYSLGQDKQFEIKELEVIPTHWRPRPSWNNSTASTPQPSTDVSELVQTLQMVISADNFCSEPTVNDEHKQAKADAHEEAYSNAKALIAKHTVK